MKQKRRYTEEELLFSLPDYVSGKLDDLQLKEAIGEKIGSDNTFKRQFEEVSRTLGFIQTSGFSEPPENYFASLSAKINSRISEPAAVSWWESIGLAWKILVPAVTVIALLMIFLLKTDDRKTKLTATDTSRNSEETITLQAPEKQVTPSESDLIDSSSGEDMATEKVQGQYHISNDPQKSNYAIDEMAETVQSTDRVEMLVADNLDEISSEDADESSVLLNTTEVEEPVEEEFLELTPEDQAEILKILKNS